MCLDGQRRLIAPFVRRSSRYWTIDPIPLPTDPKFRKQHGFSVVSKCEAAIYAQGVKLGRHPSRPQTKECNYKKYLVAW